MSFTVVEIERKNKVGVMDYLRGHLLTDELDLKNKKKKRKRNRKNKREWFEGDDEDKRGGGGGATNLR